MISHPCTTKFALYEPLEIYRRACPYVLVVCKGVHHHPIPLPTKTPPQIKADVIQLLKSTDGDLADLTPRRFLRHPILKAYLKEKFPTILNPTLCELHSSLANREHLRLYIKSAKVDLFPEGTGWKGVFPQFILDISLKYIPSGVLRLKEWQDLNVPAHEHYIRHILEVPDFPLDEFDDQIATLDVSKSLRLVICMSPTGSRRLTQSSYLQSDIGFKRVVGFHEFEIASMDYYGNTSKNSGPISHLIDNETLQV